MIQMQRYKSLLNRVFTAKNSVKSSTPYFSGDDFLVSSPGKDTWSFDVLRGVGKTALLKNNSEKSAPSFTGKSFYKDHHVNTHVGFGISKILGHYDHCSSHIEMIYSEGAQPLIDGLNPSQMEQFVFYVIFEINTKGGRFVKALKSDKHGIVDELKNYSWFDTVRPLKILKGYPLGIIDTQDVHSEETCDGNCHCKFKGIQKPATHFSTILLSEDILRKRVA